jgi:uncharacterized protein (DUF427 family)
MSHQSNTGNRIHLQWIFKSLLVPFVCVAVLATAIGIAAAANTAGPGDGTYGGYTTHYWGAYILDTTDGTLYGYCVDPGKASPDNPAIAHDTYSISTASNASEATLGWLAAQTGSGALGLSADDLAGAISMLAYNTFGGGSIDDGPVSAASISTVTNFIDNYPGTWTISASLQAAPAGGFVSGTTYTGEVHVAAGNGSGVPDVQILSPAVGGAGEFSSFAWTNATTGGGGNASFRWTDDNAGDSFSASFTSRYGLPTGLVDIGLAPAGSGGQTMLIGITRNNASATVNGTTATGPIVGAPVTVYLIKVATGDATDTPIAGAVFNIANASGTVLYTGVTTQTTPVEIDTLIESANNGEPMQPDTTYEVIETAAPQGYSIPTDNVTSFTTPASGGTMTVTVADPASVVTPPPPPPVVNPSVYFIKASTTDPTDTPIAGAVFSLANASGTVLATGITSAAVPMEIDQDVTGGMVVGSTYELIETAAPVGYYVPTNNVTPFTIPAGVGSYEVVVDDPPNPTSTVATQVTVDSGLPGTVLSDDVTISGDDGESGVISATLYGPVTPPASNSCSDLTLAQWEAGATQSFSVDITGNGTYTVTGPTATSAGCYGWSDTVTLTPSSTTSSSPPTDPGESTSITVPVYFIKASTTDPSDTPIAGAVFSLANASGTVLATGITSAAVPVEIDQLVTGGMAEGSTYELIETQAPPGYYVPTNDVTTFTVPSDVTSYTVLVTDPPVPTPTLATQVTVDSGLLGTVLSDDVTVSGDDAEPGIISATLYGPVDPPASNSCSDLTLAQWEAGATQNFSVDITGNGSYTVTGPTATSAGCYGWSDSVTLTPSSATGSSSPTDPGESTSVTVPVYFIKASSTDPTDAPVAGAVFSLANASGTVLATRITSAAVPVEIDQLVAGGMAEGSTYELIETQAPLGYYVPTNNVTTFTVPSGVTSYTVLVTDPPMPTPAFSTQVGAPVVSVATTALSDTVTVSGDDGEAGVISATLYGPVAVPSSMSCGDVTLAQWEASTSQTYSVDITGDGPVVITGAVPRSTGCYAWGESLTLTPSNAVATSLPTVSTESSLVTIPVSFVKASTTDPNDTPIAGAVFTLESSSGVVLATGLTSATSAVAINAPGVYFMQGATYELVEVTAPPGYYVPTNKVTTFTIPSGATTYNVIVTDPPMPTPALSSQVSAANLRPDTRLTDSVVVVGDDGESGFIQAVLYGPVTPPASMRCSDLTLAQWEAAATQIITVGIDGNGTYSVTGPSETGTGCYAWADSLTLDPSGASATSSPLEASEQTLVAVPVTFIKTSTTDPTNTPVAGAVFSLATASGNILATGLVSGSGPVAIDVPGLYFMQGATYELIETRAPSGYYIPVSNVTSFTIPASATTFNVITTDPPIPLMRPASVVSQIRARYLTPGGHVADSIDVTVDDGEPGTITGTLYGPVAPPASMKCSDLTLAQWEVAPTQVFTAVLDANGTGTVMGPVPTQAGCYGWAETVTLTASGATASTPPTSANEQAFASVKGSGNGVGGTGSGHSTTTIDTGGPVLAGLNKTLLASGLALLALAMLLVDLDRKRRNARG